MVFFLTILSICFALLGLLIAGANWWLVLSGLITRKRQSSVIPLIGGISLSLSLLLFPWNPWPWWCWIGLLLDYGCLPGLTLALTYNLFFAPHTSPKPPID